MRFFKVPERTEQVVVELTMDGSAYLRAKKIIDDLGTTGIGLVHKNDTVRIDYTFSIEYYNVVIQLRALNLLLEDPEVTSTTIDEAHGLNILFVDLIDTIRTVQAKLVTENIETKPSI